MVAVAASLALLLLVVALWGYVFVDQRRGSGGSGADGASAATASTSSASSASSSSSPTSDGGGQSLEEARTALAGDDSQVLVLGDSTGDGTDEWVSLWAGSQELPVALWDTESEAWYNGATEQTRVWSGAMVEATADYPVEHEEIWPTEEPDLVLLSYGHFHESGEGATEALEELRAEVTERAPEAAVVVVLQNPQADDANADTRAAIATWAEEAGLPTVDVAAAFEEAGTPEDLRVDSINPSAAGSQLWAETVGEALESSS